MSVRYCLLTFVILAATRLSLGQMSGVEYFETKIRPLFVAKCQACHGPAARKAGLDLSSEAGFQKGPDSGFLVSGSGPEESRLLRAIGYQSRIKMPPTGKLKEEEIAVAGQGRRGKRD